jgi:hypothetical protein
MAVIKATWNYWVPILSISPPPDGGMGLVPKCGCLLTLAYYAFHRWWEFGQRRWNDILTEKTRITWRKTCPSAILSTTNPTWIDLDTKPGLRGEKPATNNMSHGKAYDHISEVFIKFVCQISMTELSRRIFVKTKDLFQQLNLQIFFYWISSHNVAQMLELTGIPGGPCGPPCPFWPSSPGGPLGPGSPFAPVNTKLMILLCGMPKMILS